jgi:hypothetical protein
MRVADILSSSRWLQGDPGDLALLALLALVALAVGGLLGPRTGRWTASFVTGGTIGFVAWWSLGWLWPALVAAGAAWLLTLMGTVLWHRLAEAGA